MAGLSILEAYKPSHSSRGRDGPEISSASSQEVVTVSCDFRLGEFALKRVWKQFRKLYALTAIRTSVSAWTPNAPNPGEPGSSDIRTCAAELPIARGSGRPKRVFRRDEALAMRAKGLSWRKIAGLMDVLIQCPIRDLAGLAHQERQASSKFKLPYRELRRCPCSNSEIPPGRKCRSVTWRDSRVGAGCRIPV